MADSATGGMDTAGYYSESPVHDLEPILVFMASLPVLHLALAIATCLSKTNRIQETASRVTKSSFYLQQNIN